MFLLFCGAVLCAQQVYPQTDFVWPLEGFYRISGSFGALRGNHFHSGIDISTNKKEGFPVKCASDGYVVRIKVSPYGYGRALYVNHPNGFTTVYAHLSTFSPEIEAYVKEAQYAAKKFDIELFPHQGKFKFKQNDIIAYSGNTGGSTGPHLHFEIRDTRSEDIINPLLFGFQFIDSIAPVINRNYLLFQINDSVKTESGNYPYLSRRWQYDTNGKKYDTVDLPAGTYGLAIDAEDFYNEKGIGVGVNCIQLLNGAKSEFTMKLDRFAFSETRYINCHIPYAYYYNKGQRFHSAFVDDGNKLSFYNYASGKGRIALANGQTQVVNVLVKDIYDSTDTAMLVMRCIPEGNLIFESFYKQGSYAYSVLCRPHIDDIFVNNDIGIKVHKGALYDTLNLQFNTGSNSYGTTVQFRQWDVPLHRNIDISLRYTGPESKRNKAVIYSKEAGEIGGTYAGGFVTGYTRNLGNFYIVIDDDLPTIKGPWVSGKKVRAFIYDNLTGIADYDAYIDGEWLLMEYDAKKKLITGELPALAAGKHVLKITVTDNKANKRTATKVFYTK